MRIRNAKASAESGEGFALDGADRPLADSGLGGTVPFGQGEVKTEDSPAGSQSDAAAGADLSLPIPPVRKEHEVRILDDTDPLPPSENPNEEPAPTPSEEENE